MTAPKRLAALGTISPTSVNTALLLSSLLTGSLARTTHMTIQAVTSTVYIRFGGSDASSSDYGVSLAVGEKFDIYASNWALVSVQGTGSSIAALCYAS